MANPDLSGGARILLYMKLPPVTVPDFDDGRAERAQRAYPTAGFTDPMLPASRKSSRGTRWLAPPTSISGRSSAIAQSRPGFHSRARFT